MIKTKIKTNGEIVDKALDIINGKPGIESSILGELSEVLYSGELKSFLVSIESKIGEAHSELVRDFRDYTKILQILESLKRIVKKCPKNPGIGSELFGELMETYEDRLRLDKAIIAWKRLERWEEEGKFSFLTGIICDLWSMGTRFKYNRFY